MFVSWKIWRALFSWNIRFEIRAFALLPTILQFQTDNAFGAAKHIYEKKIIFFAK